MIHVNYALDTRKFIMQKIVLLAFTLLMAAPAYAVAPTSDKQTLLKKHAAWATVATAGALTSIGALFSETWLWNKGLEPRNIWAENIATYLSNTDNIIERRSDGVVTVIKPHPEQILEIARGLIGRSKTNRSDWGYHSHNEMLKIAGDVYHDYRIDIPVAAISHTINPQFKPELSAGARYLQYHQHVNSHETFYDNLRAWRTPVIIATASIAGLAIIYGLYKIFIEKPKETKEEPAIKLSELV